MLPDSSEWNQTIHYPGPRMQSIDDGGDTADSIFHHEEGWIMIILPGMHGETEQFHPA